MLTGIFFLFLFFILHFNFTFYLFYEGVGPTPPYPFNGYTRIAEGRKRKNRSTELN